MKRYSLWPISECDAENHQRRDKKVRQAARSDQREEEDGDDAARSPIVHQEVAILAPRHDAIGRRSAAEEIHRKIPPRRREGRAPGHGVDRAAHQGGHRRPAEQWREAAAVGGGARPRHDRHDGRRQLDPRHRGEAEEKPAKDEAEPSARRIARLHEIEADDQDMGRDHFVERARAKIDGVDGNRRRQPRDRHSRRTEETAPPKRAAQCRRGGKQRQGRADKRDVDIRPFAERARYFDQTGERSGQHPASRPILEFPRHHAVTKHEFDAPARSSEIFHRDNRCSGTQEPAPI